MESTTIQIKITGGDNIKPSGIRAKEIGDLIAAVEEMIASQVIAENSTLKKDSVRVALTGIAEGSIGLTFSPNLKGLTFPAANSIAEAINTNKYDNLSTGSTNALKIITKFTQRHECKAEFYANNGSPKLITAVTSDTVIPDDILINGETTIYGEASRVGGVEPKVQFRTIEGILLHCQATKTLAREIGAKLYTEIGLRGRASWNSRTLKIEAFIIEEVVDTYKAVDLVSAFTQLGAAADGAFDEIEDVDIFANKLRYDAIII